MLRLPSLSAVRTICLLCAYPALLLTPAPARALPLSIEPGESSLIRFAGVLSEPGKDSGAILRRFEALLLTSDDRSFFTVIDDPRDGCPWTESFGALPDDTNADAVQPHIVYLYDGVPVSVNLPPLQLSLPADLDVDSQWRSGDWTFTVQEQLTNDGSEVWQIQAAGRRGRHQQLLVEAKTGVLVEAEMDVFMGRGDQFLMTFRQTDSSTLPASVSETVHVKQTQLLELQKNLGRRPDAQQRDLTARQVQAVESAIRSLIESPSTHPLSPLVQRIQTDLKRQQGRLSAGNAMADRMIGQPAPAISLQLINGRQFGSDQAAGRTVILHFWHYRDQPLTEPYGQTGYLEYLQQQQNRSRADSESLVVVGVSTNSEFQSADTTARARRSARKLAEFMNLSYDVGYDDGALLRSFGDPRDAAGSLPLWIVINPQGQITHYHAGNYEIDPREGLKELQQHLQAE